MARELAAAAVVGIAGEDADAGGVGAATPGGDVADDVVGHRRDDRVVVSVKPLREDRRAVEPLLLAGVQREDDGRVHAAGEPPREDPRELDYRGGSGAVVVRARGVRRGVPRIVGADARVVVRADHHHAVGVATLEARHHIREVHRRPVGMARDDHRRRVVVHAETATALSGERGELRVDPPPGRTDAAGRRGGVAHRVTGAECHERRVVGAEAVGVDGANERGDGGVGDETTGGIERDGGSRSRSGRNGRGRSGRARRSRPGPVRRAARQERGHVD